MLNGKNQDVSMYYCKKSKKKLKKIEKIQQQQMNIFNDYIYLFSVPVAAAANAARLSQQFA
jgi:hypothetical protein